MLNGIEGLRLDGGPDLHLQDCTASEVRAVRRVEKRAPPLVRVFCFIWGRVHSYSLLSTSRLQAFSLQGILLCFPFPCESTGIRDAYSAHSLYISPGDLNSGPHTCTASDLPAEPSPWSLIDKTFLTFVFPSVVSDCHAVSYRGGKMLAQQSRAHTALFRRLSSVPSMDGHPRSCLHTLTRKLMNTHN